MKNYYRGILIFSKHLTGNLEFPVPRLQSKTKEVHPVDLGVCQRCSKRPLKKAVAGYLGSTSLITLRDEEKSKHEINKR
ncbi:hypothetical protein C0J52_07933 [Blattella germanica]|nr:hypothetical protein C0J52_07933 [Blattella germanica]